MILTAVVFLLVLSALVLIHELGHFIIAKYLGIKVEEFGFGFPPRAISFKKGETIYSVNWLPIGGFVKLYGEDEAGAGRIKVESYKLKVKSSDLHRAFFARSAGQKAAVVVAGVVMNVLLAIGIFYAFMLLSNFKTDIPLLAPHQFAFVNQQNRNIDEKDFVISAVFPNSPAENAGLRPPVEIVSVNGANVSDRRAFIELVNKNRGKEITLAWKEIKTGKVFQAKIIPRATPPKSEGPLGVGFFPFALLSYDTPFQKAFSGIAHTYNVTSYTVDIMSRLLQASIQKKTVAPVSEGVSGPVGIYSLINDLLKIPQLKEKILGILNVAGALSISLAFFNILPIPALDGGRFFFILIELTTGRKVHPKFEEYAHTIGMIVLLALIALIAIKDFSRLFAR